jgi:hypothetical protein
MSVLPSLILEHSLHKELNFSHLIHIIFYCDITTYADLTDDQDDATPNNKDVIRTRMSSTPNRCKENLSCCLLVHLIRFYIYRFDYGSPEIDKCKGK